jgi:hypothetical protein
LRVVCGIVAVVGLEEAWRVTRSAVRAKTAYSYQVRAVEDAGGQIPRPGDEIMAVRLAGGLVERENTGQ